MEVYKTISENSQAEVVEKKSKFIANTFKIETEEDAEKYIKQIKKKYHDARHNCYAYRVINNSQIIQRFSDDGEPSGTAGAPMLAILEKLELTNVLVIVTRYFGGILLGTGGLVKAYSEATKNSLEKVDTVTLEKGYLMEVVVPYSDLEKFKYFCKHNEILIKKENYIDNINLYIELPKKMKDVLLKEYQNYNFKIIKSKIMEERYISKNIDI